MVLVSLDNVVVITLFSLFMLPLVISSRLSMLVHVGRITSNNIITTTLSKETSTTTTLVERCIQKDNKDRSLNTTKDLQEFLSEYSFYNAEIDGEFGPQTETALRKFQEIAKIKVDGKFGPETKSKIRAWTGCES